MEWLDLLIRLLALLFLGLVPVRSEMSETVEVGPPIVVPMPAQPGDARAPQASGEREMMRVPAVIEAVNTLALESDPVQIQLQVSGYHPDGCATAVYTDQRREGNRVLVEIYRLLPTDVACPMILAPYEDTIPLGSFESGSYTIDVNGYTVQIEI